MLVESCHSCIKLSQSLLWILLNTVLKLSLLFLVQIYEYPATSNFSVSHSVFKRLVLQARKNQGLFGKG